MIKLISIKKYVDLKTFDQSIRNRDLTFVNLTNNFENASFLSIFVNHVVHVCCRCMQHFISKNMIHKQFNHYNKNIKQ